jgi:hypothetical protein
VPDSSSQRRFIFAPSLPSGMPFDSPGRIVPPFSAPWAGPAPSRLWPSGGDPRSSFWAQTVEAIDSKMTVERYLMTNPLQDAHPNASLASQ